MVIGPKGVRRVESDKARFEQVFRDNARAVLSFALSRTQPEEAKDVVAQTFLVAWRRFAEVPEDPLPWLIGVARRTLADLRRADRRREALRSRLSSRYRTVSASVDLDVPEQLHLRGSIGAALRALRPDDRDILVLTAWRDFTVEQLAEALGCSKPTASVRLHRARRRFATLLDEADAKSAEEASTRVCLRLVREVL
jgi:RNA polymerase sigma-70 factor (ECF subfamily)